MVGPELLTHTSDFLDMLLADAVVGRADRSRSKILEKDVQDRAVQLRNTLMTRLTKETTSPQQLLDLKHEFNDQMSIIERLDQQRVEQQ